MERLKALSDQLVLTVDTKYKRYLYNTVNWDNRLIVLKGSKGVGKTTLMLQHIKESFPDLRKVIYVNLDHIWFTTHSLNDFVQYYQSQGVTHFFFDEAHKYPLWMQEIKNVYDYYPRLHFVVSGSSLLKLQTGSADLSRRKREYTMQGLSFREYLMFEGVGDYPELSLEDILARHTQIAAEINSQEKVLPHFSSYLHHGYYPFYKEEGDGFEDRLRSVIDETINVDIPAVSDLEYGTLYKLRQLISILSDENPYTVNLRDLGGILQTTRNTILKALDLLEQGAIVRKIYVKEQGMGVLKKPEKILFDNPNIIYALAVGKIGTVRETFFASQMGVKFSLTLPESGDFVADGAYTFEVGGHRKTTRQLKGIEGGYVVRDDIEIGVGNKIPLWLFGMLY